MHGAQAVDPDGYTSADDPEAVTSGSEAKHNQIFSKIPSMESFMLLIIKRNKLSWAKLFPSTRMEPYSPWDQEWVMECFLIMVVVMEMAE